jgi:hypothetical protein
MPLYDQNFPPTVSDPARDGYIATVYIGNTCSYSDPYRYQCQNGTWVNVGGATTTCLSAQPD